MNNSENWNEIITLKTQEHKHPSKKETEELNIDLIIVLAGGLTDSGYVHPWVAERLNMCMAIHNKLSSENKCPILLCGGGTYHRAPILNQHDYVIHESTACAQYLTARGIQRKYIYREWGSYDTIANAVFSAQLHVQQMEYTNILIITSEFHMPRSKAIFEWVYKILVPYTNLTFICSEDEMDRELLELRKEREKKSLNTLITQTIPNIKTPKELYKWFYSEHKAYCHDGVWKEPNKLLGINTKNETNTYNTLKNSY